jgi:predicted O-linked N-acetylglucosamine transferase (SPINDLY family)
MSTEAALALLRDGDPDAALDRLRAAPADPSGQAGRFAALGMVLLAGRRASEAADALRHAVCLGDDSAVTALNLALALDGAGQPEAARRAMRELAVRNPSWDEPWLRLAESRRAAGDGLEAEDAYWRALGINPVRPEALIGLSMLLIARGEAPGARALLLRCCRVAPCRAEGWDALGLAYAADGDHAAACTAFTEAQQRAPGQVDFALHRVEAALAAGAGQAELARLEVAADADPLDVSLLVAVGVLRERLGFRDAALDALEAAAVLAPEAPGTLVLLGGLLARAHRLRDAERILRRAAAAEPDNPRIQNDLAAVLMRVHRHPEAHRLLTTLRDRHGASASELCNLATATASLGRQEEAVSVARDAVAMAPDALLPRRALYNALVYRGAAVEELIAAARGCAACLPAPRDDVRWPNAPDPARRLRLGLLSGSLKTHPVGWLTVAGFEALDPAAFEIVCLGPMTAGDPMARRFAAVAAGWHDTDALDDPALAALAREQGIDVLIDLGGWGDAGRLAACVRRLAPVQVKWVGMQAHTTGLPSIDWFLTDARETPTGFEQYYTERLLRLPDGYVCYSPPPHAPDVAPLPALRRGHVTFGCFNNLAKVTPDAIAAWTAILRRVPGARLVLKALPLADADIAGQVAAAFADHGIAAERLELRGGSPHREFLAQHGDIDIHLDPFPYSGGLTTCEALWMGVPTVTMPGLSFASRHSASHLGNVGLDDWVAPDLDGYVTLAAAKAADLMALAELRAGLRPRMKASPLCDAARFGRSLGAALRHAWTDWCRRQAAVERLA